MVDGPPPEGGALEDEPEPIPSPPPPLASFTLDRPLSSPPLAPPKSNDPSPKGLDAPTAPSVSPRGFLFECAGGVGGCRSAEASNSSRGNPDVAPCHFLI